MGLSITITFALAAWIILWSIGVKAIDAFMLTVVVALVGVTVRMLAGYLPGNKQS